MNQFANYCEPLLSHRPVPRAHRKAQMWELKFAGRDTVVIVKHLYVGASVALARKAVIAESILGAFSDNDWKHGPKEPVRNAYFEERLRLLRDFSQKHGHAEVPSTYTVSDVRLGRWVQRQRDHFRLKLERLTRERIYLLQQVPGWTWTVGKGRGRQG